MRALAVMTAAACLSACSVIGLPADTSSHDRLSREAAKACEDIPNTDEMLECRRRIQDSWRNPAEPRRDPHGLPGAPA